MGSYIYAHAVEVKCKHSSYSYESLFTILLSYKVVKMTCECCYRSELTFILYTVRLGNNVFPVN